MAEKKLDEMSKKELMDMIKNLKKENEELKVTKEFEETNKGNEFDGDMIKANMKIEEENKEKVETKNTNEEIDVSSMTKEEQDEAIKSGKIKVIVDGKELSHEVVMSVYENGGRFDIEPEDKTKEKEIEEIKNTMTELVTKRTQEILKSKDIMDKEKDERCYINVIVDGEKYDLNKTLANIIYKLRNVRIKISKMNSKEDLVDLMSKSTQMIYGISDLLNSNLLKNM